MFGRKKEKKVVKRNCDEIIGYEKVCELYESDRNKFGTEVLSTVWLYKNNNGYITKDVNSEFKIIDVIWNGKEVITDTHSTTSSISTGNSKRTGRVLGATIGTVIAPGVGTVIGAMHGTGNSKTSNLSQSNTDTFESQREKPTGIILKIKYLSNDKTDRLSFKCISKTAQIILSLVDHDNDDIFEQYEKIKKLKELLDIGAITQEEYDIKKKELLNL